MTTLGITSPYDVTLGHVAPLALGAAADTALVVDGDPDAPPYDTPSSLAALVEHGPRRSDLGPTRRGVAVLANGGISLDDAAEVLGALSAGWPRVVLRLAPETTIPGVPVIRVVPLIPGVEIDPGLPAVYQRGAWSQGRSPDGALVVPRPAAVTVRRLLAGHRPGPSRWVRAWRRAWDLPWA